MPLEMTFAQTQARWSLAWKKVTDDDLTILKDVIGHIASSGMGRPTVSTEADVQLYDVKRLLDDGKARPQAGLRLLRYAVAWAQRVGSVPPDIEPSIVRLKSLHDSLPPVDLEADHFFRHLESINVAKEDECREICAAITGKYYSYRLSRNPGFIIRSHYDFSPFNPYDRVTGFVTKLSYRDDKEPTKLVKRRAIGHIFHMDHTYVSIGLVTPGYRATKSQRYHGLQINIFPEEQIRHGNVVIDGLFLSYVYTGYYEVGPMKLAKTKDEFKEEAVGEFSIEDIRQLAPEIDVSHLMLDVSALVGSGITNGRDGSVAQKDIAQTVLTASLSFIFSQGRMSLFRPK